MPWPAVPPPGAVVGPLPLMEPPPEVRTVSDLIAWLARRDAGSAFAFEKPAVIRAAIDHVHVKPDAPIASAREIAFFPPMTGG